MRRAAGVAALLAGSPAETTDSRGKKTGRIIKKKAAGGLMF
jgi:hypothetical protein